MISHFYSIIIFASHTYNILYKLIYSVGIIIIIIKLHVVCMQQLFISSLIVSCEYSCPYKVWYACSLYIGTYSCGHHK